MRMIKLTNDGFACVSDEDYDRISGFRYKRMTKDGRHYAYRVGEGKLIGLHQDVLGVKEGFEIDHRNGDGLDNTRRNLRHATRSQNQANRPHWGLRGVTPLAGKKGTTYMARIKVNRRSIYLGTFKTEQEAAAAYDKAALEHFGEFATLNRP